jgi:rubrerythrin
MVWAMPYGRANPCTTGIRICEPLGVDFPGSKSNVIRPEIFLKENLMSFESFEDIIRFASEKEKEAVAFYEDVAGKAPFSGARETLEGFAREEQKHYDMLESFGKDREKLAAYKFKWIPDLKRSDYMVEKGYEKGMGYTDLLALAMKREEKSLKLYNKLTEKAGEEDLIRIFRMLAQEEAKHKLALETLYDDYMAEQGD